MNFVRRGVVVAMVAALTGSLVGCTKGTPKAAASPTARATGTPSPVASPPPNPCQLLTAQQVAGVMGGTVAAPQPANLFGSPACNLPVTNSHLGPSLTVQVVILVNYDHTRFQTLKQPGGDGVAAPGIGDDAVYEPSQGGVVFLKGDAVVLIVVVWPGSPAPNPASFKPQMLQLATDAAGAI